MNQQREALAKLCHEQWCGWMMYLFDKCRTVPGAGRSLLIPDVYVDRWQRQMNTAYEDLTEIEKNSDRIEADKFLELLNDHTTS